MNKNKQLCELLGICWHEKEQGVHAIFAGGEISWICRKCGESYVENPDFTTPEGRDAIIAILENQKACK